VKYVQVPWQMMSGTAFKGPPIQDRQVLNPWSQPIEEKNNYATVQKQLKPRVPAKPQPSLSHNQVQTTDLNLFQWKTHVRKLSRESTWTRPTWPTRTTSETFKFECFKIKCLCV